MWNGTQTNFQLSWIYVYVCNKPFKIQTDFLINHFTYATVSANVNSLQVTLMNSTLVSGCTAKNIISCTGFFLIKKRLLVNHSGVKIHMYLS
uniref:Uncharacterized protein n=1 Tax=Rhizophora mucronata TaxID=61149 RepID=A0A2P2PTA0_RHIMU